MIGRAIFRTLRFFQCQALDIAVEMTVCPLVSPIY